jgi:UDP-N-acetylmuramate--alanine ligase
MDIKNIHNIYFLGIGGIGMSALARYFNWVGKKVSGYDKICTDLTMALENEGMMVQYEKTHTPEMIPANIDLVVYTPAVSLNDKWFLAVKETGAAMVKRAEVLGMISRDIPTIAIAGTHGKTTITTMVAHILKTAGIEFSAFMGGISTNYNTNFLASANPKWVVVEADEYDRSFLHLHPQIALVTSMDPDHLEVYNNIESIKDAFERFTENITEKGHLIVNEKLPPFTHKNQYTYGFGAQAHFCVKNLRLEYGQFFWDVNTSSGDWEFTLGMPGKHNVENAVAASAIATLAGASVDHIRKALRSYKGVKRRFEIHIKNERVVFIDDYAHHPAEIRACVNSARELFPDKKITGIFQPHLYSRTRDLADDFAKSLSLLDEVVITDIYPARELPIEGINAGFLLEKINNSNKKYIHESELLGFISKQEFELIITMGAGDIDRMVEPITIILERC